LPIAALTLVLAAFSAAAFAQDPVVVKIDFPFVAGGKDMEPGSYYIEVLDAGPVLLGPYKMSGARITMPTMTRLGRHDNDAEPELVFDKIGGRYFLSEVWLPGLDGYLLLGTQEQHDHRILGGPRGKKK
jgi:hypothetical protein